MTKKNSVYTRETHTGFSCKTKQPNYREKLLKNGARALSDQELIAIVLRTGTAKQPVYQLAQNVLRCIDKLSLEHIEPALRNIQGMGDSKISALIASFELGRRFYGFSKIKIKHPADVIPFVQHYAQRPQEQFICISLNGANELIATRVVTVGILNRSIVHPREVFSDPLKDRAASVIVCHNHPSGNLQPSSEDIAVTARLIDAAEILGLRFLDHLILSPNGQYLSFVEENLLP